MEVYLETKLTNRISFANANSSLRSKIFTQSQNSVSSLLMDKKN